LSVGGGFFAVVDVLKFEDENGNIPFDDWTSGLKDQRGKQRILARVRRLTFGLEGDWKSVGEGVRELRISEGPGYRVYYGWDGQTVILLLCGGDKSTQQQDINTAKRYWRNYHEQQKTP
jgi:putative addiction module killer protein